MPPVPTSALSRDGVPMTNEYDNEHSKADGAFKSDEDFEVDEGGSKRDDPSAVDDPSTAGAGRCSTIDRDGHSTVGSACAINSSTVGNAPTANAAPALDHKMFPHIMDLIISLAPRESLLVFRRTSWDMCYLADTSLARHVIVSPTDLFHPDDRDSWNCQYLREISTPEGRLPLYYSLQTDSKTADFDLAENAKNVARAKMVFAKTSSFEVAADIVFENLRMYDRKILGLFTSIKDITVNTGCWIQEFDLAQLVRFQLSSLTSPQVFMIGEDGVWSATEVPAGVEGVRRTTLFLRETKDLFEPMQRLICGIDHPASLLEVVLLFDAAGFCLFDEDYQSHPHHPLGLLTQAMQDALPHLPRVRYTLVDLASVPPICLNLEDEVDAAILAAAPATDDLEDPDIEPLVEAAFYAKLEIMLREKYPHSDEDVKIRLEAVKVITVDEYIEQVGRDRFDWETTFFLDQ